eukprot:TCONS_00042538-protein
MLTEIKQNKLGNAHKNTAKESEKKTSITMKFSKRLSSNGFKIPKIKRAAALEDIETPADAFVSGDPVKSNRKQKTNEGKEPIEIKEGRVKKKSRKCLSSFLRIKFVNANSKKKIRDSKTDE